MNKLLYKILGLALCFSLMACSDDASDKVAGGSSEDAGVIAVENWDVAGVSQKGPFVTGSVVTVQELDGITLNQTGKSFKGSIKSDKGDFSITGINLSSQYALLEADGYYRDEITGKKSSGKVTLNAITDLSNRKTVNINLLTHLEYERVMGLVSKKKMSIAKAKAQAEKEIFEAFGIEGEFAESEDLNIFESGDGNAALLAVSVLMQSDVDVAGLTERIGNFSIAFAEEGTWDDADTKAKVADWACNVDLHETLANVRKNIEGWKYADSVPAFEKYVTNFWWENYGLGICNKKREGEVKKNINKLSELYEEYFTCENGRWIIPGDDKDDAKSSSGTKADDKDDAKSSSSKKDDDSSDGKDDDGNGDDSEMSSSSVCNPFYSSSSRIIIPKGLPDLPKSFAFLDTFIYRYLGYMEFGEGKQKDWIVQTANALTNVDSMLTLMADSLVAYGFDYDGKVWNDSLNSSYEDSSYVYVKKEAGFTYKVYIAKFMVWDMFYRGGADIKIAIIEDGFEEQETVDRSSLRFERDIPEEVAFLKEYGQSPTLAKWNDTTRTTVWTARYEHSDYDIDVSYDEPILSDSDYVKLEESEILLEDFRTKLVEEGFALVSKDTMDVETFSDSVFWLSGTADGNAYWYTYEKETEKAKYTLRTAVGYRTSAYALVLSIRWMIIGFFYDVTTEYK